MHPEVPAQISLGREGDRGRGMSHRFRSLPSPPGMIVDERTAGRYHSRGTGLMWVFNRLGQQAQEAAIVWRLRLLIGGFGDFCWRRFRDRSINEGPMTERRHCLS